MAKKTMEHIREVIIDPELLRAGLGEVTLSMPTSSSLEGEYRQSKLVTRVACCFGDDLKGIENYLVAGPFRDGTIVVEHPRAIYLLARMALEKGMV